MKPKYLLKPGYVMSKNDDQHHYIGPMRLARLYGVDVAECLIYPQSSQEFRGWKQPEGLIELRPKYNGDYTLPEA